MNKCTAPYVVFVCIALAVFQLPLRGQSVFLVPSPNHLTIQSAINAASNGDQVFVSAGTYVENIDFMGKAITVFGAGAGQSIIDGNQQGSCCVFQSGEGPSSILDGFTLTNGSGTPIVVALTPELYGGGIAILGSPGSGLHPTIRNCEITGNSATQGGGVATFQFASVDLINCDIHDNGVTGFGGGVFGRLSGQTTMLDCRVSNHVARLGGGIGVDGALTLERCIISDNTATVPLGGIGGTGGGVSAGVSTYRNCVFVGNSSDLSGGGVWSYATEFDNCVFFGNTAGTGAAFVAVVAVTLRHCTLTQNVATDPTGGIISITPVPVTVENSIIWSNTASQLFELTAQSSSLTANFSNIQGGQPGTGNIDADPLFVDISSGDFHLRPDSPCVGAGDGALPNLPLTDIDGDPRSLFGAPDMGADEASDIALHPAMAGTVMQPTSGTPFEPLTVNGQTGGIPRRVSLGLFQPITVSVAQPPANPQPASFAIFGVFGVPRYTDPFALPAGVGEIAVVPCPMAPSFEPILFVLTDNFPTGVCTPILPSNPTPWTSGAQAGIPFPIKITLQGIIDNGPHGIAVTNGVILEVQ